MVSRTKKTLHNSKVALLFYVLTVGLQFISRKIFLDKLGIEVLGLNTTALNLLQFINLAELGVTAATASVLYKPLADSDEETIVDLVSLQGHIYKRIGLFVLIMSGILMFFFPWIFSKMQLPLWYAYGSFSALLLTSLLTYFINYKQVVLTADQKNYKVIYSYKGIGLLKIIFQMFAVSYFSNGYLWWLILEFLFGVIASISLHYTTIHTYPFLNNSKKTFKQLRNVYTELTIKIKQVFFHKLSSFALSQSSPLIIYAYASMALVGIYGNYMIIFSGIHGILGAVFNSTIAGIGNLVRTADSFRIKKVFDELFSFRMALAGIVAISAWLLTPQLINIWIGSEYQLPMSTLSLMIIIVFIGLSRLSVDSFIMAYGLFKDVWATIVETFLNIGFSVLLGYFWGLNGILSGVIISLIVIPVIWRPYFLFRNYMKGYLGHFWRMYGTHILVFIPPFILGFYLKTILEKYMSSFIGFCWTSLVIISLVSIVEIFIMVVFKFPIVEFIDRFIHRK